MIFEGIHFLTGQPIRINVEKKHIKTVETITESIASTKDCIEKKILPYICPGFIDIQINGYAGIDYSSEGLDSSKIERIIRSIAISGTTRHLATIITSSRKRIVENCAVIAAAATQNLLIKEAIAGIHVEGPYISPEEGPRGAHDPKFIRKPDYSEFREWQDAAQGMIRIVTLAPEIEGALDFIEKIVADGVIAAIGHTSASPEIIRDAISAGASLSTHLGNGSHSLLPRLKNYLWEQLGEDRLMASIIADGFHLPDSVLRVFLRAKGKERLILISDAAFLAGSSPGVRNWGDISVQVHSDGHLSLEGTEYLAGAGHLLNRGIAQFAAATGVPLTEAVSLCTVNPARLLRLSEEYCDFVPGNFANISRFRRLEGSSDLVIETCMIAGELIYGN